MLALRSGRRSGFALLRRHLSTAVGRPEAWVSESTNPWFNLALEDHLFRTRDPATPVCLLYRNTPCVVIGRNQNPWKELNASAMIATQLPMVRRRSGGGTVYHDLGNTNYSFHIPREAFDRQTHAHLVCRALNTSIRSSHSELADARRGAYVNGRNDICIRVAKTFDSASTPKTHAEAENGFEERKVSGSAYKLVNKRAYHHGTMLLSASLGTLGSSLRNDRGGRLVTKGVASVPAPVANLTDAFPDRAALLTHSAFVKAVIDEFSATYKATANTTVVDESVLRDPDMNQGRWQLGENFDELQSWDWVFGQTPEFTHTVSVTEPNQISQDSEKWGPFSLDIHSKNGLILDAILHSSTAFPHQRELERLTDQLHGQRYDSLATPPPPWHRSPTPSTVTVASEFHTWLQNVL